LRDQEDHLAMKTLFPFFAPSNFKTMKKDIHPNNYRFVVFKDMSNGHTFLTRSTAGSKETITWEDGKEYPLLKLEISNTSHPYYTGKMQFIDSAGRIDKFNKKYAKKG
jgi:large subunit ribosomal protein L31